MAGEIHNGFRAKIYRAHHFFHLDIIILAVARNAKVDIDLGAQHTAHALRVQTFMIFVCADCNFALGDQLHQAALLHMFLFCDNLYLRGENAAACSIHLSGINF